MVSKTGIKVHLEEFYKKWEAPLHLLAYLVLLIALVNEQMLPDNLKKFGPSPIYRIVAFGVILAIANFVSPLHALLAALIVVLYVSFTPGYATEQTISQTGNTESFEDTQVMSKKQKHRWFDEEVLKENPTLIQSERVITQAPNT